MWQKIKANWREEQLFVHLFRQSNTLIILTTSCAVSYAWCWRSGPGMRVYSLQPRHDPARVAPNGRWRRRSPTTLTAPSVSRTGEPSPPPLLLLPPHAAALCCCCCCCEWKNDRIISSVPVLGGPLGPSEHLHRFFTSVQELERPAFSASGKLQGGGVVTLQ